MTNSVATRIEEDAQYLINLGLPADRINKLSAEEINTAMLAIENAEDDLLNGKTTLEDMWADNENQAFAMYVEGALGW